MSDELLQRATNALRDETSEPELRSGLTRARLLASAAKKKRGFRLRWIAPFVITLGASSALAHVTHRYFPTVWNAVVPAALEQHPPEIAARKPRARAVDKPRSRVDGVEPRPLPAAEHPAAPLLVPSEASPEPAGDPATGPLEAAAPKRPRAARHPVPQEVAPVPVPVPVPVPAPAAAPAESAELALFRRAMKLHEAGGSAAISAWDDFLRVAAASPLAPEARYNRALGLVRAGRTTEAASALTPFARGDYGSYRAREASDLLRALAPNR